jgi:hypothetical protein
MLWVNWMDFCWFVWHGWFGRQGVKLSSTEEIRNPKIHASWHQPAQPPNLPLQSQVGLLPGVLERNLARDFPPSRDPSFTIGHSP